MRRFSLLSLSSLSAATLASAATLLAPAPAQACGGTFCDGQAMPVEQTGENILFVQNGDEVQAHIQIQYNPDTDAGQFAWVIPVVALPEFSVGSEELFQNLLDGSVPQYGRDYDLVCDDWGDTGAGSTGTDGGDSSTSGGDGDGGPEPDPDVVYQETVGAYDITVLQGGTVESLMQWLGDNGYTQDPASEPIFQDYLDEGYLFVALKLTTNAEVAEIHPIVLTQNSGEKCVPLMLTSIAAEENMEVRTFHLGNARTVPTNYKHVLVNPLRIDWDDFGSNYKEVISLAVDHADAEGRAFVTEYAGNSDVVPPVWIHPDADGAEFNDHATPSPVLLNRLSTWGLMSCDDFNGCEYGNELLKPILDEYAPVPDGVNPWDYYQCPECYEGIADWNLWDGAAFGQKLEERILEPARNANQLLADYPYLTRLYTTISPYEMTEDPIFEDNPDLEEVPALRMAQGDVGCNDETIWTLPGGIQVYSPNMQFPDFPGEDPWAMTVEQGTIVGANQIIADMCPEIRAMVDAHNAQYDWQGSHGVCADGDDPGGESTTGDPTDGDPTDGNETSGGTEGSGGGLDDTMGTRTGCACDLEGEGQGGGLLLLGLAGLGLRRRRR